MPNKGFGGKLKVNVSNKLKRMHFGIPYWAQSNRFSNSLQHSLISIRHSIFNRLSLISNHVTNFRSHHSGHTTNFRSRLQTVTKN